MTAPTEPGIYSNVPESVYHGDRDSISSSQARRLLEMTPHRWKWERDNPKPPSDAFDFGTAVHTLVLGIGAPPVDSGYEKWQSNEAKAEVARIRAEGGIPLKPKDFAAARAAADRVLEHPTAATILSQGVPELSAWARDPETGVMLRARPDWMRWLDRNTAVVDDFKTSSEPGPDEFMWSVAKYGYHRQQPWIEFVLALLGITVVEFRFLVVCSDPPHEVYVVDLPARAVELGARDNRRAIERFAECWRTGIWPSHADGIHHIDLPEKTYRQEEWIS